MASPIQVQHYAATPTPYEATAASLERALWGTPSLTLALSVDDHVVASSSQEAGPADTHLSWAKAELGLEDGRVLTVRAELDPRLPYPRLPHEYRAWLA